MKILIWIGCILTSSLIYGIFGLRLGGIPAVMFFGSTIYLTKKFVFRYENQQNKTSQEYLDNTKGIMKGVLWYGASILYVLLGALFDPESFDFGVQMIIMMFCVGLAGIGHWYVDKKVTLKDPKEQKEKSAENIEQNGSTQFCRKCGTHLEADSRFCRKCGTEIKEEQQ